MSLYVIRAFVKMREDFAATPSSSGAWLNLTRLCSSMTAPCATSTRNSARCESPPQPQKPQIGFHVKEDALPYRIRRRARARSGPAPGPPPLHRGSPLPF